MSCHSQPVSSNIDPSIPIRTHSHPAGPCILTTTLSWFPNFTTPIHRILSCSSGPLTARLTHMGQLLHLVLARENITFLVAEDASVILGETRGITGDSKLIYTIFSLSFFHVLCSPKVKLVCITRNLSPPFERFLVIHTKIFCGKECRVGNFSGALGHFRFLVGLAYTCRGILASHACEEDVKKFANALDLHVTRMYRR